MEYKRKPSQIVFDTLNTLLMILIGIACLYPFYYIFIYSISDPLEAAKGIAFLPKNPTLANYTMIFRDSNIINSFFISAARTVLGAGITVLCSAFLAYLFTNPLLPMRKGLYKFVIITMYLSSGLIPWYVTMSAYGLKNKFLLYIVPSAVNAFFMILIKTYMESLPAALSESAELDGAGIFALFFQVILPLCLPVIAAVAVFAAVGQWNSWSDNFFLVKAPELKTLQLTLYEYFQSTAPSVENMRDAAASMSKRTVTLSSIRMSIAVVTVIPIFAVYPFMMRFFVKGIMLGAVKG